MRIVTFSIAFTSLAFFAACSRQPVQQAQFAAQPAPASPPAQAAPPAPSGPPLAQTAQYVPSTPPAQAAPPAPAAPPAIETPTPPEPASFVIPSGTPLVVRIDQELDTKHNRAGDRFPATLRNPVIRHGEVMIPAGTRFYGHVTESRPSGRFKGRAHIGLELDSFELNGATYHVNTANDERVSKGHKKRNFGWIGGGAGLGATLGAVAGGGAGALIGAGAGAAAGTTTALFTGKKQVAVRPETIMTFRTRGPIRFDR